MLFINFLCLLYLMVLADSHTISKSIDNYEKVDDIFESISDVDRPTILKKRKDRQHKYKLYYSKDDDVLQGIKETKPYSEVEKATDKITVKPTPKPTTEYAKRHKSPKRRVSSLWKKLRGKDKKKETEKHDPKDRKRRISSHKKESHKIAYLTTKLGPAKNKAKKKHRKKMFLRQPEHKVSKRDVSGLFSTRPYSNTPQSYKLQMGIAPQVDNMLKSKKCKIKPVQSHTVAAATADDSEVSENLQAQLERIYSNLSKLKERYGLEVNKIGSAPNNNPSAASSQRNITTTESEYQGTAQIDNMLRAMKSKAVNMMSFQTLSVTELSNSSTTEATIDSNQPATVSKSNKNSNEEKRTIARTYALNPKDSTINTNTESHNLAARSIKEDAMTIAMNVEDLLQKELKNLYNKVKHKVSNDFHKEVHTAKSTLKDGYEKISSKITGKSKSSNITSSNGPSTTTSPPTHRTCPYKPKPLKTKEKPDHVLSPIPARTSTSTITTTAPRVKKKDEKEEDRVEDSFTPEAYGKQTYDDYVMLTLYEQMLAKSHEDNAKKLLGTPEFPIYAKNKREARRLSKRNPETLTDVKLTEVVRNIYDDGGNMPDYDYIDPAANVSSAGRTISSSNSYNDVDYIIDDSSGSADYNFQGPKPLENKPKVKGTSPVPKENCNAADADNSAAEADNFAADADNYARDSDNSATVAYNTGTASGNPASETSFEGLSNKISYNQFVDGYKHYLKFQQELKNQNFSNFVKYQAHRHHSVDDIGKYILNKIPPLPTFNKRKRNLRFSDDSDNNMDYQEITTKSDDSWFRKHFYLFIDNGPPKKYHTSETVELKPGSVDLKLYITDTTPTTRSKEEVFIRIDSNNVPRKAKNAHEISLDDLSKILDSIKVKVTNHPSAKATPPEAQKEYSFINMDTFNATDEATMMDSSFIGKFLGVKRRQASKKSPITTMYFPTTNYMYAENQQGRFKRSNTKVSFENTLMADFMHKDIMEEKAATTGTKEVFADAAQTSHRDINKYGYVDIDLVPRQTAVVKLRDNTKKSRIKNFFKKFHFKKDKSKKPKPKRSAYYNYYSPNPRRERFNPIKKLRNMFKTKEGGKDKDLVAPSPFRTVDYDMENDHMAFKPKFEKPMSVAEMQKQIPNISDTYFEPFIEKHTTKEKAVNYYKLDEKDQDLLYNYHPSSPSTKPLLTSLAPTGKPIMITAPAKVTKPKQAPDAIVSTTLRPSSTISKTPKLLRVPPCNVMTVNVKTLEPTKSSARLIVTETSSPMAIDDMSVIIEQIQKELRTSTEYYPTITTMYDHDSSFELQTKKYDYKKNAPTQLPVLPDELSIRSKLTRFVKFPIRQRRYKMKTGDNSEPDDIERDNLGFDGPSVLQYIHDLGSRNAVPSEKRKAAVNTFRKLHPHTYNPNEKQKSVYTDYFNDLLMWHNDILNLDSVPNPLWVNILKTLQTDTANSYTTPDMKNLMIELNEMNEFLGNNSAVTAPTNSTEVKAKDHVGIRALDNQLDDDEEGVIRSVAMDDNTIVTSKDILIKGEAKYYQYNKPKPHDALASSNFVMKLNKICGDKIDKKFKIKRKDPREESTTPADTPAVAPIIVDTTLMAYDDDVDSITKELEVKKSFKARSSKKSRKAPPPVGKTEHTSVSKTNKAPVQYYTTPLPMKSQDFHRFLKDHQMGVDFVTAPILELPTLIDSWTNKNSSKGSKQNGETLTSATDPATVLNDWNTESTTPRTETIESTTARSTSSRLPKIVNMAALPSKLENITKTVGKFVKSTTKQPKRNLKVVINSNLTSKNSYWNVDFDRYKRFNALKQTTSSATVKSKATHEPKYYGIFKKKMKDKLFDKKVTEQVVTDRLVTDAVTVDPHNKEVEITIINFDDLDKMSTTQPFDTFSLQKKDEIRPFTDFSDIVTTDTTFKTKMKITTHKDEDNMHNELLYKDIFNERTTSTARTREYSNTDLTKRTEYVDPLNIKDGQTVTTITNNKFKHPFEKAPICPSIFNKMPHMKNFNMPKRVHITSHHYKYDIFYDDVKRTGKNHGGEGLRLKAGPATSTAMKLSRKRAPTIWGTEGPHYHKKRKYFTFRGCKPKSTGGLSEPIGYFEEPILTSSPGNSTDVSMPKLEEGFTEPLEYTGTISLAQKTEPLTDIEDLVTVLDRQDLAVTNSDIESAVNLAAIRTEFLTSISVRDNVRIALARAKAATADMTRESFVTTTTPATTAAATSTRTVPSSPLPGSLVYSLNHLEKSSNKSSKDKEKQQGPQRDRHRRLFKFSVLQSRLKNFMKNLTMTTKHASVTTPEKATSHALKSKTKRTCIKYIPEPEINATTTKKATRMEAAEELSDEREGFCITHRCEETLAPPITTTLTVRTSVITTRPVSDVDRLHYEDELPTYNFECPQKEPPKTPPRNRQHHCTHHATGCVRKKPFPKDEDGVVYVEPEAYNDQIYEETEMRHPPTIPSPCEDEEESTTHCDFKREVQPNTFTAKDVAALEVIVDLMKNTLNYDDNSIASGFHHSMFQQPSATRPIDYNGSTNAIQVHIAIPYDFQNGKKRSPPSAPGPVRVRKVFSAKMSTPVDLEYQVHSIEGTMAPTSTKPAGTNSITSDSLTPGMYLLIDKPKDGYALKPLLGQIHLSDLKSRQLPSGTTASMSEPKPTDSRGETTSLKSLARVTLSKDFVAAINQQLLELYENRSRVYKEVDSNNTRKVRSVWRPWKLKQKKERRKKGAQKYIAKRRIDWDAVKKYFGHDRVCNCKCKSNTTMCRACAASDAVIDELIFEFDNIGHYMADHCTEIQTFFWMNPIGGQKLRDSVNKIDRSLSDYCKRVKGKCQGRLCKTFSTYIDKRNFIKTAKIKKVEDISCLINDLATLAHDLNMTVALNVCYNHKLKENGEKFINLMNNCINYKSLNKRSNPTTTPKQVVKHVYSLDNINVNIICNPESPSTADEQMMAATISPQVSSQQIDESKNDHLLDFDLEENRLKKRKFIHLFPSKNKKSKLLSYFDFNKKHYKRQVDNQASKPLISDSGGAFWYDYLKAGTNEPRLARGSIKDTPTITVDVVQRVITAGNVLKVTAEADNNDLGIDTIYMTVRTRPERNPRDIETSTDSLSRNINQMLQLFGSLQDVESMNNNTNSNLTTNLPRDASLHRKVSQDKRKKISLVDKVKQTVDKALAKNRTTATTASKTRKHTPKIETALEKEMDELSTIERTIEAVTLEAATTNAMSDSQSVRGSSDNVVVISSMAACKVITNTPTTTNSSTTVSLAAKSTTSKDTATTSTTVALKVITPMTDKKSETTPVVNETTTKFGFKNMIKAATEIFKKGLTQKTHTPKKTTKISTTVELHTELTPIQTGFVDIVTGGPDNDYVVDENTQNTTENPTILIINDYGSQVSNAPLSDDMKENYKNLLLSIIQFETNNLNDEWDRIAYGGGKHRDHRDETDIKRSVPRTPKVETKASIRLTPRSTPIAASSAEDTYLVTEPDTTTKAPTKSLLNKIANKIGIKVINQKKVVKKPSIREPRKDSKRTNFIRNRKLRINTYKQESPAPVFNKEACHTRRTTQPAQICDIQATFKHIQNLQKSVPTKVFENLMKNISCYKYRNADASFIIPYKKRGKTWDWIRNKRSLKHFHNKIKDDHDFDDETYVVDFEDDDIFERFVKGDNGIYKIVKRKKRKVNFEAFERGLRNIPTLTPNENELYVMVGDSVTLDCGINTPVRTCDGKFHWKTDRKRMLEQDNVEMDGLTVAIHNVEPKNSGTYTCSLDRTVRKNVMLNVMDVPSFDVIFLPVYKTEDNCSYDDLLAIQRVGSLMANETRCGKACSVRIDEPVCQKDRSTNNTMVRATAVISMTARAVNCSLQCKRDIVASLVMLSAANAAILSSIPVEVSREGVSETLTPWTDCARPVVTHTLRKKDSNGHQEYHQLSSLMSAGKVDVVLICPDGYHLLSKYKLCSSCPPNTSSKAGDNTCRTCPRGTRAGPGAATCHVVKIRHHRRYDWWWYPPCGYVVACCGVLSGCTACVLLSVIVHVVSRDAELPEHDGDDEEQKIPKPMPSVTVAYAHFPGARPLSPSRVILPRFFRPSLTSSRATDSQETKFELWKERNMPPPLPPIDFDP